MAFFVLQESTSCEIKTLCRDVYPFRMDDSCEKALNIAECVQKWGISMKILNVTAQKPDSTGSGVYLAELVKEFEFQGQEQAVIAGVYESDTLPFSERIRTYPVYFGTKQLPFAIAGMSDEMPYESTVYGQMTEEMLECFEGAFKKKITEAVEEFEPDVIVCHHLYLVTSFVRELYPDKKVVGFCHNTDLRQMKKIPLKREYIREQIQKLDKIFALHEEQKQEIIDVYKVPKERIQVVGVGYNQHLFYAETQKEKPLRTDSPEPEAGRIRLIFAGKLSEKKGVLSLLKSLSYLKTMVSEENHLQNTEGKKQQRKEFELVLAGGYGKEEEYAFIKELAAKAAYPVRFLGRLSQKELADEYRKSDIFVLPSFYEGLPMTVIEAMACGNMVVVTDLPGVRPWIEANVKLAPVVYIPMPKMKNTDEPLPESLPAFERHIAEAVLECSRRSTQGLPDLSGVSWEMICHTVMQEVK